MSHWGRSLTEIRKYIKNNTLFAIYIKHVKILAFKKKILST